jgi:hypothetical protein
MTAMNCVLYCYFAHDQHADAIRMLRCHLCHQWGEAIHLMDFKDLLLDSYEFLVDVSMYNYALTFFVH